MPDGREAERRPDGKRGYFITLPHGVVDRLNYLRKPGQSYFDVILALPSTSLVQGGVHKRAGRVASESALIR